METRANYVLIGAFTLLTGVLLLLFSLWASNFSSSRDWREYRIIFSEPVTGLTEGGSVQYNGLSVGTVETLNMDATDPRNVIAVLKLKANTPIKEDTRARLSQQGITGVPFILLSGGSPEAQALRNAPDGGSPIIRTAPSALQNITDAGNRLITRLDQLLSEENIQHISATLEHLDLTTQQIAAHRNDIGELLRHSREASASLKTTLDSTNTTLTGIDQHLVQRLPKLIGQLERSMTALESAAGNVDAMMVENRPAINAFTHDGLAQIGPTLSELRALIRDLRTVSERLEGNPARYILGRDAPKEFDPK